MATGAFLLALDIGTTGIKAACVDASGRVHWANRIGLSPTTVLQADFGARHWLRLLPELLRHLPFSTLAGIAISGQGPTTVAVDAAGDPLDPLLSWFDKRAMPRRGQRSYFLPQIAWLKQRHPEVCDQARWFLGCPEFIAFKLGGDPVVIPPAHRLQPYWWDMAGIAAYNLSPEQFPPVVAPGTQIGVVHQTAAEQCGLPVGLPIFAAGIDFAMSLIGSGVVVEGRACDCAGSSEYVNYCAAQPVADRQLRCLPHIVAGHYNIAAVLQMTGMRLEWLRSLVGAHGSLDDLITMAFADDGDTISDTIGDTTSIVPYDDWDFGRSDPLGGSVMADRPATMHALLEAILFALRSAVALLDRNGCPIDELRLCGGQARSRQWNQLKADVLGIPVALLRSADAELIGAAGCGFVGLGRYSDPIEASINIAEVVERIEPRPQRGAYFAERYAHWLDRMPISERY